ncbi:MAG: UDP-N-acetylmuramoyl-tripeptide--D-alanyl-D-alanine ligase [Candidatus Edwardsbacteria bacterium]
MEEISLKEVLKATGGILKQKEKTKEMERSVRGVSIDSRTIKPGEVFVAIKGPHFDGHQFVEEALSKRASAAIVSQESLKKIESSRPIVVVKDTLAALQELARYYRKKFNLTVIAVTGTNGKTTTKEMIATVLSPKYKTLKSEGNLNNQYGIPLTLFNLSPAYQICVLEMGMSALGEIAQLCELALPSIGVITNIAEAHLEFLKNIDNIARAKAELLHALPAKGFAILNADDKRVMAKAKETKAKIITFGIKQKAEVKVKQISEESFQTIFLLEDDTEILLSLLGRHNIYNALAAIATAKVLGITTKEVTETLQNFKPAKLRMEHTFLSGIEIINDAYNANPTSMKLALEVLSNLPSKGRKIAVLGDMLELGPQSQTYHKEIGKFISSLKFSLLLTVGQEAKYISEEALKHGMKKTSVWHFSQNKEAVEFLKDFLVEKDLVLVKGSRKMRLEEIIEDLKVISEKVRNH